MSKSKDPLFRKVLYAIFQLFGCLPAWWHYFWSDLFSLIVQYVIRYRRDVVQKQLRSSFPEKSERELRKIERQFYRYLCDLAVEVVMLTSYTEKRFRKHVSITNPEIMHELHEHNPNVFYLLGHYGNWEWFTGCQSLLKMTEFNVLYKHQKGVWNYIINRARSKFGSELLDRKIAGKRILERRHEKTPRTYIFVADQTPSPSNILLFTTFLNQKTATFTGMERLARMIDCAVVYIDVQRVKRGKYEVTIEPITHHARELNEYDLATEFMRRLEQTIRRNPAYWLWSHKRWKYTVESVKTQFPEKHIEVR